MCFTFEMTHNIAPCNKQSSRMVVRAIYIYIICRICVIKLNSCCFSVCIPFCRTKISNYQSEAALRWFAWLLPMSKLRLSDITQSSPCACDNNVLYAETQGKRLHVTRGVFTLIGLVHCTLPTNDKF